MKRKATLFSSCFLSFALVTLLTARAYGEPLPASNTEPKKSAPIPMDQLGAVAGKQYHGDGLSVIATPDGARLRCAFQRLEGHVTHEGLWLSSTADTDSGERFRVMAVSVGRADGFVLADPLTRSGNGATTLPMNHSYHHKVLECASPLALSATDDTQSARGLAQSKTLARQSSAWSDFDVQAVAGYDSWQIFPTEEEKNLPPTGVVNVAENVARFIRDGLTEEYTVSVDGVRQDFIVEQRPGGEGELRVELDVTGAKAEPLVNGVRLVLDGSGRKLAYNRLRVVDATGRELPARMEVAAGVSPAVEGGILPPGRGARTTGVSGFHCDPFASSGISAGLEATTLRQALTPAATRLAVLVDDAAAIYPVRIDPTFSDADWISMGGFPGANWEVFAAVAAGSSNLYIGGNFTIVGDVFANRIAKWDGSRWTALGLGMNNDVRALAVSGSNVYAGGRFMLATNSSGVAVTVNRIAKWNGSSWTSLGLGMNNEVLALAISDGELYAGGLFTTAGGSNANYIAKWNGSSWTNLASGIGALSSPAVYALTLSGSNVYVGGNFTKAGGSNANHVAKWNGSSWTNLASGMSSYVYALAVSGTDLYVGGQFTRATNTGGTSVTVNRIAKWNGSTWSALGSGMNSYVYALAVSENDLYAGGYFTTAGGSAASNIAKWDGNSWSALNAGLNNRVNALAAGAGLFAGGAFRAADGSSVSSIAKWSGSNWSALASGWGINGQVMAMAVSGSEVYVGGRFTTAGGSAANNVAKWDGGSWLSLGSGVSGGVIALAVAGSDLYAGGDFTTAGGIAANFIAKWNGSSWSALGSGMDSAVFALAGSGSNVYAGGQFTMATNSDGVAVTANYIAKWNGSSWSAMGSGMFGNPYTYVFSLSVSGSDVYAGGIFSSPASYIAKWNGSGWSALGSGVGGAYPQVSAIVVSGSDVYAGGIFETAGGLAATNIAKWSGHSWTPLGQGVDNAVYAMAISGSNLYAGGAFATAGGNAAQYIAKWDGSSWTPLGSGVNGTVLALATPGSDLYAGGEFAIAGGKVSAYIARANPISQRGLIQNIAVNGVAVAIDCLGLPGTTYAVERATDVRFTAGLTTLLTTNAPSPDGLFRCTDSSPPIATAFYRLRRQ